MERINIRFWFYFHVAVTLVVSVPVTVGIQECASLVQFVAMMAAWLFPMSPLFGVLIAIVSALRREKLGILAVVVDVEVLFCQWMAFSLIFIKLGLVK
jgi:hypothetical protein